MGQELNYELPLDERMPREVFLEEVKAWAKKIGVEPKEIHLRPMKNKWASCSSKGRITFNVDILREPAAFRKKVIIHELLHYKLPVHGKLFNSLLKAYIEGSKNYSQREGSYLEQ